MAVVDAEPALLRRVDEHQAAEGPERLAAKGCRRFLVHHDHPAAGVGQLGGRDPAKLGQAIEAAEDEIIAALED